jgi:hypothetical protein
MENGRDTADVLLHLSLALFLLHCFDSENSTGTFKEGSRYEGGWHDGKMHGPGTLSGDAHDSLIFCRLSPSFYFLPGHGRSVAGVWEMGVCIEVHQQVVILMFKCA